MELHLKVALFVLYQISKSYVTFISSCFKYPGKFLLSMCSIKKNIKINKKISILSLKILFVSRPELIVSLSWFLHDNLHENIYETISQYNGMIKYFCQMKFTAAAAAKSLQSRPTLCDPIDGSPPGSPIPGILQVRTLEWVAISFSSAWKRKMKVKSLSRVWFLATPWTAAHQAPPSIGFSRQEYWSGVPLPSPEIYYIK